MDQVQLINFLAEKQVEAVISRGGDAQEIMRSLFCKQIGSRSEDWLTQAKYEFELFERYTHDIKPKISGLYLKLLHGRSPVDLELDDWGETAVANCFRPN